MKLFRIAALLIVLTLAAPAAFAEQSGEPMLLNIKNADIEVVVKTFSELTGKSFILDEKVRGQITVYGPTPVAPSEAYEVFQAILGVKGFTIVPAGKVFKIMSQADARQTNIETVEGAGEPGDRVVTRLVRVKNVSAQAVTQTIDQLRSKFGSIVTYEPTNLIIITDSNSNIERLLSIIEAVDVATPGVATEIVRLRFAEATAVANTLTQALTAAPGSKRTAKAPAPAAGGAPGATVQGDSASAFKVIADARTNILIIIADPASITDAKSLINALDVELPSGKGKINVVQLRYADAEAIATVLNSITQAGNGASKPKPATAPVTQVRTATTATAGTQPTASPGTRIEDLPVQFDEPVNITADKATNSLVIVALPQDFATLKSVIDKLDVLRPQVLVEALIIEMSYNKAVELGVEWRTTSSPDMDGKNAIGGTNFGNMTSLAGMAANPFAAPTGMFVAGVDGTIKVGNTTYPNVGVLLRALQTKGDVEILSTPNLLTTNNEEGEIVVSTNIPYKTSTVYDSNGNPRDNFEYRDVGLTLRFTPQINDDDYVKLKLFQESSDVISYTTGDQIAPATSKRTAKTTVLVKDGSTIVIGGLIRDKKTMSQSAVPCLGDIPVLGVLFRSQGNSGDKANLMIFLTPRVIRDQKGMQKLTDEKRGDYKEFSKKIKDNKTVGSGVGEVLGFEGDSEQVIKIEPKPAAPAAQEKKPSEAKQPFAPSENDAK